PALADRVRTDDPEPGAAIDAGLNPALTPEGSPDAVKETGELKPPDMDVEIVELPDEPCTTESEVGDADIEKSGVAAGVTVKATLVV
ncbi:MAG TPA: hypothetical protein VJX67_04625, partial [Blastocatellia bacterium]|nr:hypothetical protein [Blastocatellia bacterium]